MEKLTTTPAVLIYSPIHAHVAKEKESKKELVRIEQFPIYNILPLLSKYLVYLFASGFCIHPYYNCLLYCLVQECLVFVKNGIMDTVQFGKDVYAYLKNLPQQQKRTWESS